jgi:NAD-dependent dihydropyrimidine dehydrogenase PreA subunit
MENVMGKYGTWQGILREKVPWHPTVDAEKCVGCQECFNFCGHGVYAWDEKNNKTKVVEPFQCVVGCSNCAGKCPAEAIKFPPLTILKDIKR